MKRKALIILLAALVLSGCGEGCNTQNDVSGNGIVQNTISESTSGETESARPEEQGKSSETGSEVESERGTENSLETGTEQQVQESISEENVSEPESMEESPTGEVGSPESEPVTESEQEEPELSSEPEAPVESESSAEANQPEEQERPSEPEPTAESESPVEPEPPTEPQPPVQTEHVHSYSVISTTAATCQSEGSKTYGCVCGNSYVEMILRTGHNDVTDSQNATCNAAGYTKTYCTMCGRVSQESSTPATGQHNYTSAVTIEATCSAEGVKTLTCSNCGDTKTESIPKAEHSPVLTASRVYCDREGEGTYTCAYCGVQSTGPVPALGGEHDIYEYWYHEPRCDYEGYLHAYRCTKCNYYEDLPVGALGHDFVLTEVLYEGDCLYERKVRYGCTRCKYGEQRKEGLRPESHYAWDVYESEEFDICIGCGATRPKE